MLRYTGVAGRPEWYFRVPGEQSWADRWQIARDAGGSFDYRHAKLGAVHPDIAGADRDLLTRAFSRPRFVHLWRDDTVAQAVSWVRAEQTNY